MLYNKYIENKLSDETISDIFKEAVEIEIEFITESIPCSLLGMNSELMIQYIKYVANRLILQLNHKPLYTNIKQPFSFMDRICLDGKTNFFERVIFLRYATFFDSIVYCSFQGSQIQEYGIRHVTVHGTEFFKSFY